MNNLDTGCFLSCNINLTALTVYVDYDSLYIYIYKKKSHIHESFTIVKVTVSEPGYMEYKAAVYCL